MPWQHRHPPYDELARRRQDAGVAPAGPDADDEPVRLSYLDTLAMIIAAYQILLPVLGAFVVALFVVYLLFRWLFA